MQRIVCASGLLAVLVGLVRAQQSGELTPPTFRSAVNLVQLDVSVVGILSGWDSSRAAAL